MGGFSHVIAYHTSAFPSPSALAVKWPLNHNEDFLTKTVQPWGLHDLLILRRVRTWASFTGFDPDFRHTTELGFPFYALKVSKPPTHGSEYHCSTVELNALQRRASSMAPMAFDRRNTTRLMLFTLAGATRRFLKDHVPVSPLSR